MTGLIILFLFVIGIAIGSFLNAWVYRVQAGKSILRGRSICTYCTAQIVWYDNIPLVSFFVLQMQCRRCKKRISWQYPLVELWMGLVFIFIFYIHSGAYLPTLRDAFIIFFLTFIFLYDLRYQQIYDLTTIGPAVVLFIVTLIISPASWFTMAVGALIGGGFFLLQYILSKGKWIGAGDILLGIFMGVVLGWPLTLVALALAYIVGALIMAPLVIMKKIKRATKIPFGTFLTLATFVTMFWGGKILDWYVSML